MKYYLLRRYTPEGKYCSHDYYEAPDTVNIRDYFPEPRHLVNEIKREEFEHQQPFYRHTIKSQFIVRVSNLKGGKQMPRTTTGRCHHCNIRYAWQGKPRLKDAYCPKCKNMLHATTHLFKGQTITAQPIYYS